MNIIEIEQIFNSGDKQAIERMARKIFSSLSHELAIQLSQYAQRFDALLLTTDPNDRDYLALVYILAGYLNDIQSGKCPCTIINKPMFNCPSRLTGILNIVEEKFNKEQWSTWVHSKCKSCGAEYESERVPCGHGERVFWSKIS